MATETKDKVIMLCELSSVCNMHSINVMKPVHLKQSVIINGIRNITLHYRMA